MRAILLAATLLLAMTAAASPPLESGVSLALAQWRAKQYRDLRYALRVQLAEGSDAVRGALEVSVTAPRKPVDLILDWRGSPVRNVRVNGEPVAPEVRNEHLRIARKYLKGGRNTIQLEFESPVTVSGSAVTRYKDREDGSEYLYTLLVPADARTLFPCFDQPDLKARFSLEMEIPAGWKAISNAPVLEDLQTRIKFQETEPISTYLFAFAAGPFEALRAEGDPTRLYVRRARRT